MLHVNSNEGNRLHVERYFKVTESSLYKAFALKMWHAKYWAN